MESPFLHFPNLEKENAAPAPQKTRHAYSDSPFLSAGRLNGKQLTRNKQAEAFATVMSGLHDDEFTDQLEDLLNEMKTLRDKNRLEGFISHENYYYAPLDREVDGLFDTISRTAREVDEGRKNVRSMDEVLEAYSFSGTDLTDVQEQFLGGLKKLAGKAVNAVKKGVQAAGKLASKVGLGFLFDKLKGIIKQFLSGFLQKGINMLPEKYRGMAKSLAGKIKGEMTDMEPAYPQDSIRDVAEEMQDGINAATAQLLIAENETDLNLLETTLSNTLSQIETAPEDPVADAREHFVSELQSLEHNDDPAPAVEQFATVVTTALKFVLPLIGREKVINWMTPLLGKLIGPFVGKENADTLSRMMIDKGFKMLNLETAGEEDASARAIAETVENTIRQVPEFPSYVLQDRQLFERYVVQAFEKSAAAYLPDVLPDSAYAEQPELRETNERAVMWKQDDQAAPFKALTEVITTEINPYTAQTIRTFGGIPLSVYLRDKMGINISTSTPVRVHLFEAAPGKNLFQIAQNAARVNGLGSAGRNAWMQLHPLTSVAAGLLMREPGLGCKKSGEQCISKRKSSKGHRFYFLEIDGARPQYFQPANGRPVLRKHTTLKSVLDFPAGETQVQLYLGEQDAQAVAACIRKNQPETAHVLLMTAFREGVKNVFTYGKSDYLKIIHPNIVPGNRSGLSISKVPPVLTNAFGTALQDWAGKSLIGFLRENGPAFVAAADSVADGVSLHFSIGGTPGLQSLGDMLTGRTGDLKEDLFSGQPSRINITVNPGYDRR